MCFLSSFCHGGKTARHGVSISKSLLLISDPFFRIKTAEKLSAAGIPCTVVLDSAVAYAIEKVDFVLMGSEAVVESGGLVNAVGSNQIAIIAKAANKPFYALAERSAYYSLFCPLLKTS